MCKDAETCNDLGESGERRRSEEDGGGGGRVLRQTAEQRYQKYQMRGSPQTPQSPSLAFPILQTLEPSPPKISGTGPEHPGTQK